MGGLVDWLVDRQNGSGQIDSEFARGLGVSRALWRSVKYRQLRPSLRVVAGAVRRWPEHRQAILDLALPETEREEVRA